MNDRKILRLQQQVNSLRYELQGLINLDSPYEVLDRAGKVLASAEDALFDLIKEATDA